MDATMAQAIKSSDDERMPGDARLLEPQIGSIQSQGWMLSEAVRASEG